MHNIEHHEILRGFANDELLVAKLVMLSISTDPHFHYFCLPSISPMAVHDRKY